MKVELLDRMFTTVVFLLGLMVVFYSWQYGLYRNDVPGPGFFPAIAGVLMLALAAAILVRDMRGQMRVPGRIAPSVGLAIAGITFFVLLFVWIAPIIGMAVAGFIVMAAIGYIAEEPHKRKSKGYLLRLVLVSAGTVVVCHVLFGSVIGTPLVEGPLGF
jgi:hypothetical protein